MWSCNSAIRLSLPVLMAAGEDEECHRRLALVHKLTKGRRGAVVEPCGKVVHADLVVGRP